MNDPVAQPLTPELVVITSPRMPVHFVMGPRRSPDSTLNGSEPWWPWKRRKASVITGVSRPAV